MRRIGHRGAMGHAPGNTLASFLAAIDLGCDAAETDVWLTADGALRISHDPPGPADGLALDAALDFCAGRLPLDVELKCVGDEARARETGAAVALRLALRGDPGLSLSSFWWAALDGARAAAPEVRRAYVYVGAPDRPALIAGARAVGLWALHPHRAYLTPELVADAHAAALRVNVWTVDDPDEIARLGVWGVDGIVSDHPERIPKD